MSAARPRRHGDIKERFQELKDFILEWYGSQDAGGRRVIGKTKPRRAVALVCEDPPGVPNRDVLTLRKLNAILDEALRMGLRKPVDIWAHANIAPISQDLYIFHQVAVWPPNHPAVTHNPVTTEEDSLP